MPIGDNLHEMSNLVFWKKYFKMSSAGTLSRVLSAKRVLDSQSMESAVIYNNRCSQSDLTQKSHTLLSV